MPLTHEGITYSAPKSWSNTEEELLKQHWGHMDEGELERLLNRPLVLIKRKAKLLKLHIPESSRWTSVEVGTLARNDSLNVVLLQFEFFKTKSLEAIAKKRARLMEKGYVKRELEMEICLGLELFTQKYIAPPEQMLGKALSIFRELHKLISNQKDEPHGQ